MCQVKISAKDRRPAEQAAACHVAGGWIQGVTSRWAVLEPSPLSAVTRRQLSASEMPRGGFHSVHRSFSRRCSFL